MRESEDYYFKEHINPNYTNYSKELKIKKNHPGVVSFYDNAASIPESVIKYYK